MCSSVLTVAQGANSYSSEDKPRALKGSLGYREGVAEQGCEARPACLPVRFWGHILEKAMAPHSSTLAWKIPRTEEPGRLQSMGLRRVVHDHATSFPLFTFMHWRRKWQPTPVFLPGESQGWGSLVGCRLWGYTELDTTEATQHQQLLGFLSLALRHVHSPPLLPGFFL